MKSSEDIEKMLEGLGRAWPDDGSMPASVLRRVQSVPATVALPRQSGTVRILNTWRWVMRSQVSRIAAVVVLVLAIAGAALWLHSGGATLAFADIVRPILEAKTLKYKQTTEIKGPPATP